MKILIDPGHGGIDPGATAFGISEKDWTLKLSAYQFERFKELGIEVELTRNTDTTLDPVTRIAKVKNRGAICLSNHFNAFDGKARGIEVIHSIHSRSRLSETIADNLVASTGLPLRRVFTRTIAPGKDYYFMHRLTGKTNTIIIEYGFLDHLDDFTFYQNNARMLKAGEAVIKAVCEESGVAYLSPASKKLMTETGTLKKESAKQRGKQKLISIHDGQLRFYSRPSWKDQDVFGHMRKGQHFSEIIDKVKVGRGEQYRVRNSKGDIYFVTAHPDFVELV